MKSLAGQKYSDGLRGKVARYFGMKDESSTTFAVEILGGVTMYASSLALFGIGGCPQQITLECANSSAPIPESLKTAELTSFALVTGLATLLTGLIAKVPLVLGPGLPFSLSFRRLMCHAPQLQRDDGLAANLIVGICFTCFVVLARKVQGFIAIPEDFRLGMAAGIAALIGAAAIQGTRLLELVSLTSSENFQPVVFQNLPIKVQAELLRMPILSGIGLVLLIVSQVTLKRRLHLAIGTLGIILSLSIASCVIRAIVDPEEFTYRTKLVAEGILPAVPSFANWNDATSFVLFRYILTNTVEKLFDSFATVTAIALLLVVSSLGYNKSVFVQAMKDSDKIALALLVDGIANIILAPFLNTVLLTPFVESIAGIVAGAKTGLSTCVAAVLYLVTSPVIRYVVFLLPNEAINPVIIYAALFSIRSIQYLDFRRPTLFVPAFLCLFFIPLSLEIGVSTSIAYLVLFFAWMLTKYWICINPQMVFALGLSMALVIAKSSLTRSALGILYGLCIIFVICLAIAAILFRPKSRNRMKRICGNIETDHYFADDPDHFLDAAYGALPKGSFRVVQPSNRSQASRASSSAQPQRQDEDGEGDNESGEGQGPPGRFLRRSSSVLLLTANVLMRRRPAVQQDVSDHEAFPPTSGTPASVTPTDQHRPATPGSQQQGDAQAKPALSFETDGVTGDEDEIEQFPSALVPT